jgi:integrase
VFCSGDGQPFDDRNVRDAFYTSLLEVGLGGKRYRELPSDDTPDGLLKDDPIVLHDLRHTFGTLGAAIWPLNDLRGYMGHADIQTTMIYVHHVPKIAAADELSRAVAAAMGAGLREAVRERA